MEFIRLRKLIKKKYRGISAFSKVVGASPATISNKLNGKTNMTVNDIMEWSKILEIGQENIPLYFFTFDV